MHSDLMKLLDAFIASQPDPKPSRPEAVRRLVETGLTSEVDQASRDKIEIFKQAIYWRGMLIQRYAAVEYAITDLVAYALSLPHYGNKVCPRQFDQRIAEALSLAESEGPLKAFALEMRPLIQDFNPWRELRNFMVHGIMTADERSIKFEVYQHRKPEFFHGTMVISLDRLRSLANDLAPISSGLTGLVGKMPRSSGSDQSSHDNK